MGNERKGGIIFFKVDGQRYDAKGEATYKINNTERSSVVGQDGVHGHAEIGVAPTISITITDASNVDLEALNNTVDATITCELANGKTVVFRECVLIGGIEGNSSEGELSMTFEGRSASEI